MFGFNTVSLDAKGRLLIPARYRNDFKIQKNSKIVITKDPPVSYTHLTLPTKA